MKQRIASTLFNLVSLIWKRAVSKNNWLRGSIALSRPIQTLTINRMEVHLVLEWGDSSCQSSVLQLWDTGKVFGQVLSEHETGSLIHNTVAQNILPIHILWSIVSCGHFPTGDDNGTHETGIRILNLMCMTVVHPHHTASIKRSWDWSFRHIPSIIVYLSCVHIVIRMQSCTEWAWSDLSRHRFGDNPDSHERGCFLKVCVAISSSHPKAMLIEVWLVS